MSIIVSEEKMTKYSPFIFEPLVSQVSLRNMLSSDAVYSLGDMIYHMSYSSPHIKRRKVALVAFHESAP